MSDATATDIMLDLAERAFSAGYIAAVQNEGSGRSEESLHISAHDAWSDWEPTEDTKDALAELDERLEAKPAKTTSPEIASLAARVLNEDPRPGDANLAFNALLEQAKKLAGSALSQREEADDGPDHLGIQVNLIDVFEAWGQREAKDTAMLITLCLGAALEQLVPMTVDARLWPAEVVIKAEALEQLAESGRIVRLKQEPNQWAVRLDPPAEEEAGVVNPEWGNLGWVRRHIKAFYDYHDINEKIERTADDGADHAAFHEERRKFGAILLAALDGDLAPDAPKTEVPGENPPEKENGDSPERKPDFPNARVVDDRDGTAKPH